MERPYFVFDLENNKIAFYGEFQATRDDSFLDAINELITELKINKKEKITMIFKDVYLEDVVLSSLIFHLISEIIDQKINLQVLWYYCSQKSLDAGQELTEVFKCDFKFFEE